MSKKLIIVMVVIFFLLIGLAVNYFVDTNAIRDGGVTNIAARLYENSVNIKYLCKLDIWQKS